MLECRGCPGAYGLFHRRALQFNALSGTLPSSLGNWANVKGNVCVACDLIMLGGVLTPCRRYLNSSGLCGASPIYNFQTSSYTPNDGLLPACPSPPPFQVPPPSLVPPPPPISPPPPRVSSPPSVFTCGSSDDVTTCLSLADLYAATGGSGWTTNTGWSAASVGSLQGYFYGSVLTFFFTAVFTISHGKNLDFVLQFLRRKLHVGHFLREHVVR